MGIHDRDYYRGNEPTGFELGGVPKSAAIQLIAINVIVFIVCAFGGDQITKLFALRGDTIFKPWMWWQFLTYAFVHSTGSGWHLAGNLLGLWFFGTEIEAIYGRRTFLRVYFAAAMIGAIVWAARLCYLGGPEAAFLAKTFLLGASGGVSAIIILFCLKLPNRIVNLMFVLPVPAWLLGVVLVVQDLVGNNSSQGAGVAFDVHLTGAAIAFLFFRYGHHLGWSRQPVRRTASRTRRRASWFAWLTPKPKLKIHTPTASADSDDVVYDDLDTRGDEVLQKWHREGEESLSPEERKILEAYSRRMQQKLR